MANTNYQSIDEYIAACPESTHKHLQKIRKTIKQAVPEAREKISYQIAAFELNGKNLIYFAGWKNHISIYPIPSGNDSFNKSIKKYIGGKGTLKFPLDQPIPYDLIARVAKLHAARIKGK